MLVDSNLSKPESVDPVVLWISGFSAAGKTTAGRKVRHLLKKEGVNAVFLDGDDLRSIFGGKWGYLREDRIELAHAYFRLCNALAAQGVTVIISAVAMYEEIFHWVKKNVDRSLIVYLKVPEKERIERDRATKKIYSSSVDFNELYDEPKFPDITIENYGLTSPDVAAKKILAAYYEAVKKSCSDKGRTEHWNKYYESADLIYEPSTFSQSVSKELCDISNLLEIGCGNGRDAIFFSKMGHNVIALDPSKEAITLCRELHGESTVKFKEATLPEYVKFIGEKFDAIYSRFCFHAMTEAEEIENIKVAYEILNPKGRIYIECRSINDPLSKKGEVISPTERIYGHYRRFIIMDELETRLIHAGFVIISKEESDNLAVLGDENPVVIRICAVK